MTNGYIVLTKGEPNLYKHAVEAITLGKPIYYADGNKVAFVNSIELVSTDVVIKTSNTQITVASDDTLTEVEKGLYRYGCTLSAIDNTKVSIYFNTSEKLDDDLTFNDIKKYINVGDFGQTGELYNSDENIAYVYDISESSIDITYTDIATQTIDNSGFVNLEAYELIDKIA